jgi:PAS domain-containing protein
VGCVLALVFAVIVHLMLGGARFRRFGGHALGVIAESGQAELDLSGVSAIPVISYGRDGTAQAWNPAAKEMFGAAPPPVSPAAEPFRGVTVAILRTSSAAQGVKPVRMLLESCSLPALAFNSEGVFSTSNPAAERILGWTSEVWGGRRIGVPPLTPGDPMNLAIVLILEGQVRVESEPAEISRASGVLAI